MQKVRVVVHHVDSSGTEWVDSPEDYEPKDLADALPTGYCGAHAGPSCGAAVNEASAQLCAAEILLAASKVRSQPYRVYSTYTSGAYLEIPQQSHATNAGMLREALGLAWKIVTRRSYSYNFGNLCTLTDFQSDTDLTDRLVAVLTRVRDLAEEATDAAVENILAVSDAERSSILSHTAANKRAWVAADLSRLAAAQLIVGGWVSDDNDGSESHGNVGVPPDFAAGFCPNRPLSAQAQRAVDLLRAAAPPPAWLLDANVSMQEILNGTSNNTDGDGKIIPTGGSVRARLADLYQDSSLLDSDIVSRYGLLPADFDDAREYLTNEMRAFGRDPNETLPAPVRASADPAVSATGYAPYTALRVPPREIPDAFYVALATGLGGYAEYGEGGLLQQTDRRISLADFKAAAKYNAAWARSMAATLNPDVNRKLMSASYALSDGAYGYGAREVKVAWDRDSQNLTVRLTLPARYSGDPEEIPLEYWIAQGEKGLNCATQGVHEGRACSTTDLSNSLLGQLQNTGSSHDSLCGTTPGFTYPNCYAWEKSPDQPELENQRLYIVQQKTTGVSNPGTFTAQGAIQVRGQNGQGSGTFALFPEDYAKVARILRPSRKSCDHARISCAGASFDERLPLEDELIGDNNGVESSWMHYLDLAKQAARESDDLGSAYVNTSLEVDRNTSEESIRVEQQREQVNGLFETIQNTCGTAADPQKLLDLILGTEGGACGADSDCSGAGLTCKDGKCARGLHSCTDSSECGVAADCVDEVCLPNVNALAANPEATADPDVKRLLQCMDGGTYAFAGLGDAALCVIPDTATGGYCPEGSSPCPYAATTDSKGNNPQCNTGDTLVAADKSTDHSSTADLLALFHVSQPAADDNTVCAAIDTLRDRTGSNQVDYDKAIRSIVGSKIFFPQQITDTAKRLGFEARFGSYAAVTLDGNAIFHTGNMSRGSNDGEWPCMADPPSTGTPQTFQPNKSLWGQTGNCTDPYVRGTINDRLMKAVYLARYIGGNATAKGLWVPAWAYNIDPKSQPSSTVLLPIDGLGTGVVNEINMKLGDVQSKVYWSEDAKALYAATPAYITDGQPLPVQARYVETGAPEFLFGWIPSLWPRSTMGWLTFGEFASPSNNKPPTFTGLFGMTLSWPTNFNLLDSSAVANWFRGLSSAVQPAQTKQDGDGLLWKLLTDLQNGRPISGLDSYKISTRTEFNTNYVGSLAGEAPFTANGLLDAMEVLCRARVIATSGLKPNLNKPPQVSSPADLPQVKAYMEIVAAQIEDWASRFVIPNFPKAASNFMRQESNSGVVPTLGGTYATAMTTLRADLIDLAQVAPLVAYELRQLGVAVDQARIATSQVDLTAELQELNFQSTMANQAAACASASANVMAVSTSLGASAAVACANAVVQGIIAAKQLSVQKQQDDLQKQSALGSFQEQLNTHAQALQSYADRVTKSLEGIDGMVAELERQRLAAKRALADVIRVAAFAPANVENIAMTLAHERETARLRYEQAFKNAKLMADLAKRSIEQRLGMQLSQMTYDLPLVDAPQSWEGTLCDRSGVDWEKVRSTNPDVPSNYADAFLGDYVTKLANVVESYRLEHSFHEGSDTAVISMRDDVANVRAPCDVLSKNLLVHSLDLNAPAQADGTGGWRPLGCAETGSSEIAPRNCMTAQALDEDVSSVSLGNIGGVNAYEIFGGNVTREACSTSAPCDYQPGAGWAQRVHLKAGIYNLSYFTTYHAPEDPQIPDGVWAHIQVVGGSEITPTWYYGIPATGYRVWTQLYAQFTVPEDSDIEIVFTPQEESTTGQPGIMAAPMLEVFPLSAEQTDWRPGTVVTGTGSSVNLRNCEDNKGDYFRQSWRQGQVPLCPDGFSGSCDPSKTTVHKYWEIPFSINQRDIESGRILSKAGFALGNFNYRIESIGVNFVGTGVKNCDSSSSPTTCYTNASVEYTLDHVGPYYVRNEEGGTYESKLFTAHIEHARGLAAERYITNPISGTDQQLIGEYMRSELQGRPLDGSFVLRLWDGPGLFFDGIQDIQIVLKYRYWTRFD